MFVFLDLSRTTFSTEEFNTAGVLCIINWSDAKMDRWGGVKGMKGKNIRINDSYWKHEESLVKSVAYWLITASKKKKVGC